MDVVILNKKMKNGLSEYISFLTRLDEQDVLKVPKTEFYFPSKRKKMFDLFYGKSLLYS